MQIKIRTQVPGTPEAVFALFDRELLLSLTPPLMHVNLLRMDMPTRVGGIVHLEVIIMGIAKQEWYNEITEYATSPEQCHFTDRGVRLPAMFGAWEHRHIVRRNAQGKTEIVDDVNYKSRNAFLTVLLYPVVFLQFWYRRPIYRKFFKARFGG